ncbi:TPA: hypothetical protein U5E31_003842, partial [Yersinia enterocolitica]|nr:hypothetical protein [Yersinia enterocolitica]HEN3627127.1 hypothetical protein [Yersinia enterocolitica]
APIKKPPLPLILILLLIKESLPEVFEAAFALSSITPIAIPRLLMLILLSFTSSNPSPPLNPTTSIFPPITLLPNPFNVISDFSLIVMAILFFKFPEPIKNESTVSLLFLIDSFLSGINCSAGFNL